MKYDAQKIEDYAFGKMVDEEKAAFQFEMMRDKNLREEVLVIRDLKNIAKAHIVPPPNSNSFPKWIPILVIVLLGALAFIFFNNKTDDKGIPLTKEKQEQIPDSKIKIIEPDKEKKIQKEELKPAEKPTIKKEQKPIPIAQINPEDFTPNEYLDNFVNSGMRSAELSIEVGLKSDAIFLRENGKTNLKISGEITAKERPSLVLHIFSNKEKDFEENLSKISAGLELISSADKNEEYRFSYSVKVDFNPGLYYYVIETEIDEELIVVGRFKINPK